MKLTELKKYAKLLGVELEVTITPRVIDFDALAPRGKVFKASSCHCIVVHEFNHGSEDREQQPRLIEAMRQQLAAGFDDCDTPNCETCED